MKTTYQHLRPLLTQRPFWIKDQFIDWKEGFTNSPSLHLLIPQDLPRLEKLPIWKYNVEHRAWVGICSDGRIGIHYHGLLNQTYNGFRCTTQNKGYGGRHFKIILQSGEAVILRGPWNGAPLPGTQTVTTYDLRLGKRPYCQVPGEPDWYHTLGCFGLYIPTWLWRNLVFRTGHEVFHIRPVQGLSYLEPGFSDGPKGISNQVSSRGGPDRLEWIPTQAP